MTSNHLHLMIVHAPIFATFFGLLFLVWATVRNSTEIQNVAIALFIFAGTTSVISVVTGEGAEETLSAFPALTEPLHEHEEAGEGAQAATVALLVAAVCLAIVRRYKPALVKAALLITLLLSLVSFALLARAAYMGGQLRHSEIQKTDQHFYTFLQNSKMSRSKV